MKRAAIDWGLYLVTDRGLSRGRPIETIVDLAVRGGVTAVQLREKGGSTREYVDLARRVKRLLEPRGVPLIINDRADVALACGADGVHVGQSDLSVHDARHLMGPDAVVGLSVEAVEHAVAPEASLADYLGVSAIFATPTKTDVALQWGLDGLRALRARTAQTLVAIGGIHARNAADVLEAGADGIAVVSAICAADDPEAAARELRAIVDSERQKRKQEGN